MTKKFEQLLSKRMTPEHLMYPREYYLIKVEAANLIDIEAAYHNSSEFIYKIIAKDERGTSIALYSSAEEQYKNLQGAAIVVYNRGRHFRKYEPWMPADKYSKILEEVYRR